MLLSGDQGLEHGSISHEKLFSGHGSVPLGMWVLFQCTITLKIGLKKKKNLELPEVFFEWTCFSYDAWRCPSLNACQHSRIQVNGSAKAHLAATTNSSMSLCSAHPTIVFSLLCMHWCTHCCCSCMGLPLAVIVPSLQRSAGQVQGSSFYPSTS